MSSSRPGLHVHRNVADGRLPAESGREFQHKGLLLVGSSLERLFRSSNSILEDPSLRDYIAWSEDGKSFLVYNPSDFARDVLPRFFKHSNFSSFLRQVRRKG